MEVHKARVEAKSSVKEALDGMRQQMDAMGRKESEAMEQQAQWRRVKT